MEKYEAKLQSTRCILDHLSKLRSSPSASAEAAAIAEDKSRDVHLQDFRITPDGPQEDSLVLRRQDLRQHLLRGIRPEDIDLLREIRSL